MAEKEKRKRGKSAERPNQKNRGFRPTSGRGGKREQGGTMIDLDKKNIYYQDDISTLNWQRDSKETKKKSKPRRRTRGQFKGLSRGGD